MTAQEVFEKVTRHLLEQNEVAFKNGRCEYRTVTDNGRVLKCAAGCLIPDEMYSETFEGKAAYQLESLWDSLGIAEHTDLILSLQDDVHDYTTPDEWPSALVEVADRHDLTVPQFLLDALKEASVTE